MHTVDKETVDVQKQRNEKIERIRANMVAKAQFALAKTFSEETSTNARLKMIWRQLNLTASYGQDNACLDAYLWYRECWEADMCDADLQDKGGIYPSQRRICRDTLELLSMLPHSLSDLDGEILLETKKQMFTTVLNWVLKTKDTSAVREIFPALAVYPVTDGECTVFMSHLNQELLACGIGRMKNLLALLESIEEPCTTHTGGRTFIDRIVSTLVLKRVRWMDDCHWAIAEALAVSPLAGCERFAYTFLQDLAGDVARMSEPLKCLRDDLTKIIETYGNVERPDLVIESFNSAELNFTMPNGFATSAVEHHIKRELEEWVSKHKISISVKIDDVVISVGS